MAATSTSTSRKQRPRLRTDLPLIWCTECGKAEVVERLSTMVKNPNRIFFICPYHLREGRGCPFFYWEAEYMDLLGRLQGEQIQDVEDEAEVQGLLKPEEEDRDAKNVLSVLVGTAKVVVALQKVLVLLFGCGVVALLCIIFVLLKK